jgi:TIR domain
MCEQTMPFDAFISYSSKDKIVADTCCAVLEQAGVRCWIAPRDVKPGTEYGAAIIDGIGQSRLMVLIFSSSANDSSQIHREIERAVSKSMPIIPVRIEEVTPTKSMEYFLGAIHWLDAVTPPIEKHFQQLAETVSAILEVDALTCSAVRDETARKPPAQKRDGNGSRALADEALRTASAGEGSPSKKLVRMKWLLPAVCGVLLAAVIAGGGWFYQLRAVAPASFPGQTGPQPAAERNMSLARAARPDVDSLLAYSSRWDHACNSLPVTITITKKPINGTVSVVDGDEVLPASTPGSGPTGQCAGKAIRGKKIMYRSNSNFRGNDTINYDSEGAGAIIHTIIAISVQ